MSRRLKMGKPKLCKLVVKKNDAISQEIEGLGVIKFFNATNIDVAITVKAKTKRWWEFWK